MKKMTFAISFILALHASIAIGASKRKDQENKKNFYPRASIGLRYLNLMNGDSDGKWIKLGAVVDLKDLMNRDEVICKNMVERYLIEFLVERMDVPPDPITPTWYIIELRLTDVLLNVTFDVGRLALGKTMSGFVERPKEYSLGFGRRLFGLANIGFLFDEDDLRRQTELYIQPNKEEQEEIREFVCEKNQQKSN